MGFRYNGVHSDDMGIYKVTSVRRSLLPPITSRFLSVPGRGGAYYQGREYGVREIEVGIVLAESSLPDLRARVRALAAWLQPGPEPRPLVFDDEPQLTWMAVLSGETDLEEIVAVGRGTLTFICPDPVALGQEVTVSLGTSGGTVTPGGTAPAWPVIRATVQQPITYLAVATPEQYVLLGRPAGVEETPVEREKRVIYDQLTTTTGWTQGSQVDGGVVAGNMVSDGANFVVQSYGTGSAWHGPALKTSLPEPIQDFRVTVWLTLVNGKAHVGRAEAYLLDTNGAVIGKIALKDTYAGAADMWGEARAGDLTNGTYFVNTHGARAGVWNNFKGLMRIQRIGNQWLAYFAMHDSATGRYHTRLTQTWIDVNNQWQASLAQIQLHAGAYGSHTPMTVQFDLVVVEQINAVATNEVPYIAQVGDVLEIDCERHGIFLNGEPRMDLLDPGSQFFSLETGVPTTIGVEPEGVADLELTYRERWL